MCSTLRACCEAGRHEGEDTRCGAEQQASATSGPKGTAIRAAREMGAQGELLVLSGVLGGWGWGVALGGGGWESSLETADSAVPTAAPSLPQDAANGQASRLRRRRR